MMDLQKEHWVISCDDCDELFETEEREQREAVKVAKENGWRFASGHHYCPTCAEEQDEDDD